MNEQKFPAGSVISNRTILASVENNYVTFGGKSIPDTHLILTIEHTGEFEILLVRDETRLSMSLFHSYSLKEMLDKWYEVIAS